MGAPRRSWTPRYVGRRTQRQPIRCVDGPLKDQTLMLDRWGDGTTLQVTIRGQAGRYVFGRWEPSTQAILDDAEGSF